MTSTVIFKIDSKLKKEAQQTAEELGLTLTSVMNNYLVDFVGMKSVSFGKAKFVDPYGIFAGANITEEDIDSITKSWMKKIDEI